MTLNPLLLRRETRRPLVLSIFRLCLKHTTALKDPIVQRFWWLSLVHSFQRSREETDVAKIEAMVAEGREAGKTLERAGVEQTTGNCSLRFVTRAAYGQVVFTPRHDAFVQAAYVQKLRMGRRKQPPFPQGGEMVQVHGAGKAPSSSLAPVPASPRPVFLCYSASLGAGYLPGNPYRSLALMHLTRCSAVGKQRFLQPVGRAFVVLDDCRVFELIRCGSVDRFILVQSPVPVAAHIPTVPSLGRPVQEQTRIERLCGFLG